MKCGNCQADHPTVADVRACYGGALVSAAANQSNEREELRRKVSGLRNVLVHDCDPRSEDCHCFGQADIDAFEEAKRALGAIDSTPRAEPTRTAVPSEFVQTMNRKSDQATEKQINFLTKLCEERPAWAESVGYNELTIAGLSKRAISQAINDALARPKEGTRVASPGLNEILANVPDCYVAMPSRTGNNDLDFFRVGTNQGQMDPSRKGWRRVQRILGGHAPISMRIGEMMPVAKEIASWSEEQLKAAQVLFGQEIGRCGVCGKSLTDETSRAYGIGPICRDGF